MSKVVIAIDLDDVIVETAPGALKYYEKTYGVKIPLDKFYSKDYKNVWRTPDGATAVRRVNEFLESPEYHRSEPVIQATETIRWLKRKYELHIITGRPSMVETATQNWLERHFPDIFKTIVFTNSYMSGDHTADIKNKGDVCIQIGATIFIDDNLEHIFNVAEAGVEGLLFGNYPWNRANRLPDNVQRVKDWEEVKRHFLHAEG